MEARSLRIISNGLPLAVASLLATIWPSSGAHAAGAPEGVVPEHYIVLLGPNENASAVAQQMSQGLDLRLRHVYRHAFNGFAARVPSGRLQALEHDPRVRGVVPDRYVSLNKPPCETPPCKGAGGGEDVPAEPQLIPTGILRIHAHQSHAVSGNGAGQVDVDVAVIDTGIDPKHPDLHVVGGVNCSSGPPHKYSDAHGHGTHVAGTIGALDNDFGVVGVAPGARLWAVRVLDASGSGTLASVICGIDWVTARADTIAVANMSLSALAPAYPLCGSFGLLDPMHLAVCNSVAAGVTYTVAAVNSAQDAALEIPAGYPETVTVSALADFDGVPDGLGSPTCRMDEDDTLANFSNHGSMVDIIAPGVCIESTWKGGGYATVSGTSMAAPHVAGALALLAAQGREVTGDGLVDGSDVESLVLTLLADHVNSDWDDEDDPDGVKEPVLDVSGL